MIKPSGISLNNKADFDVGPIRVRPVRRLLQGPDGSSALEPLAMKLLVTLSHRAGRLVTRRDIFEVCWGGSTVGDDSLNRLIAAIRKALTRAARGAVEIETVPGSGYVLTLSRSLGDKGVAGATEIRRVLHEAHKSWRLGLPEPDYLRIEMLRQITALEPNNAVAWGMLALLSRQAAEYAASSESAEHLTECEAAALRALSIEPSQAEARVALASVAPLFGRWGDARERLQSALKDAPAHPLVLHDLAVLEMATGRVRAAKALLDELIAADPLAACYCYKSIYQHWSIGDREGMDHVADRAINLWPTHPAVWTARLWTLAYTGRVAASLDMLRDYSARPSLPVPALTFLQEVMTSVATDNSAAADSLAATASTNARKGPAQAIASLFALGLMNRCDEAYAVAEAYYLREGSQPVPVRHTDQEPSINDQHRRVTQILFTPVFKGMRSDPRFRALCERIGLLQYWTHSGLGPDFLSG